MRARRLRPTSRGESWKKCPKNIRVLRGDNPDRLSARELHLNLQGVSLFKVVFARV